MQPPDTYMRPIVLPAVESASAMKLALPVSEKLGADVHITCLSTIPGYLNHKTDIHSYADYRTSFITGKWLLWSSSVPAAVAGFYSYVSVWGSFADRWGGNTPLAFPDRANNNLIDSRNDVREHNAVFTTIPKTSI